MAANQGVAYQDNIVSWNLYHSILGKISRKLIYFISFIIYCLEKFPNSNTILMHHLVIFGNVRQIRTQQIKKHSKLKECESHQIFLSLSFILKKQKIWNRNGKFEIISSISRESVKNQQKHSATRYQKKLTLHEVDNKEYMIWRIPLKPKILSTYF